MFDIDELENIVAKAQIMSYNIFIIYREGKTWQISRYIQ